MRSEWGWRKGRGEDHSRNRERPHKNPEARECGPLMEPRDVHCDLESRK